MTWDTVNVLTISWAGKTVWKLAGKILNVLEMYRVGKCWVHCPFPCDVLAMYWLGTPPLAPSGMSEGSATTVSPSDSPEIMVYTSDSPVFSMKYMSKGQREKWRSPNGHWV